MNEYHDPEMWAEKRKELERTIADQKVVLEQNQHDINVLTDALKTTRHMLKLFRENYAYDTREAGLIDLIEGHVAERLLYTDRTEIPF